MKLINRSVNKRARAGRMALESNLFFRDLDEFMRFLLEVFSFLEKSYRVQRWRRMI